MKIAVIQTGGKQYLVEEGKEIEIEKIRNVNPEKIEFRDVLLYADDNNFLLGQPKLDNVFVVGKMVKEKKNKVVVLKYKPKTRYRQKKGYKKITWIVKIEKINA
ncbi:MAG: 50S ribosomal protein L21 [Candidatus Parcubacteria bacterium]|nr:MAG: 50S ribosomal protein L21 [Candidatus Parcubacteria bacterium]